MLKQKSESGQSLVLIAIMFIGLVAVAALVVDGGSMYLNRRDAQTAADAAALAGAQKKCIGHGSLADVQATVTQYAVTNNGGSSVLNLSAPSPECDSLPLVGADGRVNVCVQLQTDSFFSGVLGREQNTVVALASAGCFAPRTTQKLLPVAWACQPPVGGSTGNCSIHAIPWPDFKELYKQNYVAIGADNNFSNGKLPGVLFDTDTTASTGTYQDYADGVGTKMTYLIMDDATFSTAQCQPPIGAGTLVCDFNGDGILDITGGGERGWLNLDGNNGASSLSNLLVNGFAGALTLPQWFSDASMSGSKTSAFKDARASLLGKGSTAPVLVWVPVFNAYCLQTTQAGLPTTCPNTSGVPGYMTGDLIAASSGQPNYYRIPGFGAFVPTCISSKPNEICPAKSYVGLDKNVATIEGYFISGVSAGTEIDPTGFDLGVYMISLTQ